MVDVLDVGEIDAGRVDDDVVDVVDGGGFGLAPDCITNPQPRDGSLSESGTETSVCAGVDVAVVGGVVVVVGPDVEEEEEVVDVVETVTVVVVVVVVGLLFESSNPDPVSSSARSATARIARNRHRGCGNGVEELRICSSP
ncbi:MAG TPA: hypothetical protein VGZ68_04010 [Acidimicrobiales bacterium]|nr:hypothetical protein [Acidimicrobiales bacterium]